MNLSPGELADKLSVLMIKQEKLGNVREELNEHMNAWSEFNDFQSLRDLYQVNLDAWDCVEKIYQDFDTDFGSNEWTLTPDQIAKAQASIQNYRLAHELNQKRVTIKNRVNHKYGGHQEKKSWRLSTT